MNLVIFRSLRLLFFSCSQEQGMFNEALDERRRPQLEQTFFDSLLVNIFLGYSSEYLTFLATIFRNLMQYEVDYLCPFQLIPIQSTTINSWLATFILIYCRPNSKRATILLTHKFSLVSGDWRRKMNNNTRSTT